MYLQALASAFPAARFTQRECWEILQASPAPGRLSRKSLKVLETVLCGDSGISTRHFAIPPDGLFLADAETLNRGFEREAPRLAASALTKACGRSGDDPGTIDAVFICTCTGYLCPGVSSHVAEQCDLRAGTHLSDLTGLGCGAAIPTLHAAACYLAAHPDALVATVAVEVCSAAYYLDDDVGVLVSACLFGDGASAALWRKDDGGGQWQAGGFRSLHLPEHREKIRFVNAAGKLRNQLDRAVPAVASGAVHELYAGRGVEPDQLIAHTGGRDVIDAIESRLPFQLTETRQSLRDYGNLSSPAVLTALEMRLAGDHPDRRLWLTAFGAGFTAHACELTREPTSATAGSGRDSECR